MTAIRQTKDFLMIRERNINKEGMFQLTMRGFGGCCKATVFQKILLFTYLTENFSLFIDFRRRLIVFFNRRSVFFLMQAMSHVSKNDSGVRKQLQVLTKKSG